MRVPKTTKRRRLAQGFERLERREMLSVSPVESAWLQATAYTATQTFQEEAGGYGGTVDTYVRSAAPTTPNDASGALNIDTSDNSGGVAQALLRFDDIFGSKATQIPLDATIHSARLVVNVSNNSVNTVSLRRMLIDWTDTATWDSLTAGIQTGVEAAGGTADATLSPTATGKWTIDVTASLVAWAADPAANHGWAFLPGGSDGVDLSSGENSTLGNRPQLSVTFSSSSPRTIDADGYFLTPIGGSVRATDSGAAATAISTGMKTDPGNIAWQPGDPAGGELQTIAEKLRAEQGFAVGVVTTVGFSDATPAAMVSHNVDRGNLTQIAAEIIHTTQPEVVIGGGYPDDGQYNYLSQADYDALAAGSAGYTYVGRTAGVDGGTALLAAAASVDPNSGGRLFGLFGTSGGEFDYHVPSDTPGSPAIARGSIENPTLAQATQAALAVLSRDDQGFFVMIEQGEIDHANHSNDFDHLIGSVWDLDQAVRAATAIIDQPADGMDWTNTLVILTADHANSYLRLAQPLAPGDLPAQQDAAGQWVYPDGEVSYQTGGHTNELVSLQAVGAGAAGFSSRAGTWYPGTQIVDNTQIRGAITDAVAAGVRHVILFIGDGMQLESEIAGSRYLYGQDYGLAWHNWGALPNGWAGAASTWDVKVYEKFAGLAGKPVYDPLKPTAPGDPLANDPLLGYDTARGGTAPFPRPGSGSISISRASVVELQDSGAAVGRLSITDLAPGGLHTYELAAGLGDADNAAFKIVGDRLQTNAAFDYAVKSSYAVRVRSTDSLGQPYEKPLEITVARAAATLDADGNSSADALSDGILILRFLFDPAGSWNVADALGSGAMRTGRPQIATFLANAAGTALDADGNGSADALSDGILILRYLFDPGGTWNVDDALGAGATRTTRAEIAAHLAGFDPHPPPARLSAEPQLTARDIALAFWTRAARSADDSDDDPLGTLFTRP